MYEIVWQISYISTKQFTSTTILSGLLAKIGGRLCQVKLNSPNHWRFLKEILSQPKRLIAAVNYVKVLFQI